ncbi:aromatic ring-hydroxylating dioxygenase subunit alpha [Mycobacterium sp. NAZ190054]|uniref:aromatic ring-hydroxylating oxygenase subunit alpha n=1 Tax=Mycobacterium sp. NAZ190054 TaxID=1747766 RepID=UPI0007948462|nr:aromatic ring-hydroxylating dioxygenase subunit alpha [Mycobacterium sp. NAZ190054]KWX69078.1 hypothetical protein ASJ79_15105 [Mycobacterium sp. NAZ190054]
MTLLNVADEAQHGELVTSFPVTWYTDPAILEIERKEIFAKTWQYIGTTENLSKPGDYITVTVGDVPVVVTRSKDGINALVNVCRHRFHEVARGSGNTRRLACPYHAWSYDLEGNLCNAPREASFENFDKSAFPLVKLPVGVWGQMVFVSLDQNVAPLQDWLGPLQNMLESVNLDVHRLVHRKRTEMKIAGNWKVVAENFLECYHCAPAHPSYTKTFDVARSEGYPFDVNEGWMTARTLPREVFTHEPEKAPYNMIGPIEVNQNDFLWPNFATWTFPGEGNLLVYSFTPVSPGETIAYFDYFLDPAFTAEETARLTAFVDEVGWEDVSLIESVQRGVAGNAVPEGLLVPDEGQVVAFQQLVREAVAGALR